MRRNLKLGKIINDITNRLHEIFIMHVGKVPAYRDVELYYYTELLKYLSFFMLSDLVNK